MPVTKLFALVLLASYKRIILSLIAVTLLFNLQFQSYSPQQIEITTDFVGRIEGVGGDGLLGTGF